LKAVHHILASSAETIGAFNTGFDTVNLHRPTAAAVDPYANPVATMVRETHVSLKLRERRFRVYEEAPGFRLGPRATMVRATHVRLTD